MAETIKSEFKGFSLSADIFAVEGLTIHEQMVYIVLQSFSNPHTATAAPSYDTIAQYARMSKRMAMNTIKSLFDKGLIKKESRKKWNDKTKSVSNDSNTYTLIDPSKFVGGSAQHALGGSAQHALVHSVHQGGSAQRAPLILKEILLKEIDRLIYSDALKFYLNSLPDRLEAEHVNVIAAFYETYKDREGFTDALYINAINKALQYYKGSFMALLKKTVENDIVKAQAELAQNELVKNKKTVRNGNKPGRGVRQAPVLPITKNKTEVQPLTDEQQTQMEIIMEKLRKSQNEWNQALEG